jgi:hypothetical protein
MGVNEKLMAIKLHEEIEEARERQPSYVSTFKAFLLCMMLVLSVALITFVMFYPHFERNLREEPPPLPVFPVNTSDFMGKWELFAYGDIQSTYAFTQDFVTITEKDGKSTNHQWTFVNTTKILSVQYQDGWVNYKNCCRIDMFRIQFERNGYIYEFRGK